MGDHPRLWEGEYLVGPYDSQRVVLRYPTYTGELAFEIGANRGWLANVWARQFDHVVACEPHPGSYALLERDALPNVTPLNIAVSDHSGDLTLDLHDDSDMVGQLFTPGTEIHENKTVVGNLTVEALTLNDLSDVYGQPDFVKVDTEGHEVEVMAGGLETFAAGPQVRCCTPPGDGRAG
jgi:FkbM family methyltransferase